MLLGEEKRLQGVVSVFVAFVNTKMLRMLTKNKNEMYDV